MNSRALIVVAALSLVLLQPVCEAFGHPLAGHDAAACCASVTDGGSLDLADLAPGPSGTTPVGAFARFVGAPLAPPAATRFALPVLPARSYYARSSRLLR